MKGEKERGHTCDWDRYSERKKVGEPGGWVQQVAYSTVLSRSFQKAPRKKKKSTEISKKNKNSQNANNLKKIPKKKKENSLFVAQLCVKVVIELI